ncbi:hypothetical protein Aduo_011837 [Ancylostoma duodenale]
MYVSNTDEELVILGTNVLPSFGYRLLRDETISKNIQPEREVEVPASVRTKPKTRKRVAQVRQRMYLAPSSVGWVELTGCEQGKDWMLDPSGNLIHAGVCRADSDGMVRVPVVNRSDEPVVFRAGETVGHWEEEESDWIHANAKDLSTDMLTLGRKELPRTERLLKLRKTLAENRKDGKLSARLWNIVKQNNSVFAVEDLELSQTSLVKHEIDTGDTAPIRQRTRPVPIAARAEFKEIIKSLLERGIIERSTSPWASPVVLVKKKDGSIRLCVDYRELNKCTRQDAYPLPAIDVMLQSLQGKRYFTTLDMCSGYWQIPLSEDAKEKSAFTTSEGLFQFTVLPFGLCTSPAEFQRLMDRVLGKLKDREVFVYIDDILIATKSEERHYKVLLHVLRALDEANLKLKPQKCVIMEEKIAFLGHQVDRNGIHVDPDKIEKVLAYPRPTTIAQLRTFLGLCGYYRKFVLNFSKIAQPMYDLTSQKAPWKWGDEQEVAFNRLKNALTTTPVLAQPDVVSARTGARPFIIYTDASQQGVGAVLCQEGRDGLLHPLYFASKRLTAAERRYHITDTEALAVMFALKKFHYFVYGVEVVVRTDHQPLTALFKRTNVSSRVLRWALEIQQYRVKIEYVKGKANPVADALSRGIEVSSVDAADTSDSNERIVCAVTPKDETDWLRELRTDPDYSGIIEGIETQELEQEVQLPHCGKRMKVVDFVLEEGDLKILKEDGTSVRVVPKSKRKEVFEEAHKGSLAGHFAVKKLLRLLKNKVFWEGMDRDVVKWHKECRECFLANPRKSQMPPLKPFVASKPFEIVCADILEMGLSVSGMKYVLVVVDHFSKWLGAYAIKDKSAATVATTLFHRWICENARWPRQLHTDQGTEFVNNVIEELANVAGIKVTSTKGYNSRENGLSERAIGTIQRMLKKKIENTDNWDVMLPNVVYAYNVTPHEATGESPFFLLHGFDPFIPSSVIPEGQVTKYQIDLDDYKMELLRGMQLVREHVQEYTTAYRQKMKEQYDSRHDVDVMKLPQGYVRIDLEDRSERGSLVHPNGLTSGLSGRVIRRADQIYD